jgi:signal transduction histidine kinase
VSTATPRPWVRHWTSGKSPGSSRGRARRASDTVAAIELGGATIPTPVGQAGYRVVQEALTTVLRHAGASSARVDVRLAGDGLDIEVVDDGQGGAANGDGLGLRGMSERAAALGGEVLAGPQQRGGWRVWAHLPLTEAGGR